MKNYIIFIFLLILLSSCAEDTNAYKVEEELDIYAQRWQKYYLPITSIPSKLVNTA